MSAKTDLSVPAPAFGHALRPYFHLASECIPTNNGSFGTTPAYVLEQRIKLLHLMEENPDRWFELIVRKKLQESLAQVAPLLNVSAADLAFVNNATSGANAVLRSAPTLLAAKGHSSSVLPNGRKRSLLRLSTVYGGVRPVVQYVADTVGFNVIDVPVEYPISDDDLVGRVEQAILDEQRLGGSVFAASLDAITSVPGVIVPFGRLCALCRKYDVLSVVDGAHAIGQIELDLAATEPDFFFTNLHKWLYVARGAAVLYARKEYQSFIHPTVISFGYANPSFRSEFDYTGTADLTPYLTVPAALEFRRWLGGEQVIRERNHKLCVEAAHKVAEIFATEVLLGLGSDGTAGTGLIANMANIALPVPAGVSDETMLTLRADILQSKQIAGQFYKHAGRWWIRISVEVYNDLDDYVKLAEGIKEWLASKSA
ncbi:pyridoxal phosphate-dependent transferase [Polychytrium aggregatum]|uniref:pyridoxal phosphate-dependent transferase n=1 Tax=Polychytrium aggregatum TaxID=110093 RepID=UPI0022FF0CC6|nr:pyridoxal phosphate-dependent transferase [Polychytrium aggregatum]KAI9199327.1 pyridoxal phosphate-dependent transferase [Polychytrium aggregatum]